ncbi:MAG TPA: hypothetical protein VEJ46_10030 [Candidatus Acidoferrum sp.]|nr:hypothetical protein [Candidatus Acidoferrum sp.]
MTRTRLCTGVLSLAIFGLITVSTSYAGPAPAKANDCDRACLNGFVDQYMAAVAAHDPSKLTTAPNVRYTENNVEMKIGEGLWQTSDGWGDYKVYTDDPQTGQVGFLGVANEDGHLSCFAARLKVVGHKVTEIEVIVARPAGLGPQSAGPVAGGPTNLKDKPLFSEDEPANERVSREKLIELADGYFSTIQLNTGKIFTTFDPDCQRMENGSVTANNPNATNPVAKMGCQAQLETGLLKIVTRCRDRRYLVDEQRQMVFAATFFDHNGTVRQNKLVDGSVRSIGPPFDRPYTFLIFELFKIKNGKIRQIEAVLDTVPYYMPSPWVNYAKK